MQELLTIEEFKKRGLLKEGICFSQKLTPNVNYKLEKSLTGFKKDQIIRNQFGETYLFRYTSSISDGNDLKLVGEPISSGFFLKGIAGSQNVSIIVDTFCRVKFGISDEIEARSITMAEQEKLPSTFQRGIYLLPETYFNQYNGIQLWGIFYCENGIIDKHFQALDEKEIGTISCEVRPVISLRGSNIRILVDKDRTDEAYGIVVLGDISKKADTLSKQTTSLSLEEFLKTNPLEDGTWFRLHLNPQVYSELGKNTTGYTKVQEIKNQTGETWLFRYVEILNRYEKETILLGEPISCDLYLGGKKGYEMGSFAINSFCNVKFSLQNNIDARSITLEEQQNLPHFLKYGEYWLPEQYHTGRYQGIQCIIDGRLTYLCLYIEKDNTPKSKTGAGCDCNSVRPVISLHGKNVSITVGELFNGMTSDTPYDINICE